MPASHDRLFTRCTKLPVSAEEAFAWHERPGALERLVPPWEKVRVVERTGGIRAGARVVLINRIGLLRLRWVAEHSDYEPGRRFRDVQRQGPFHTFQHTHTFEPTGERECLLRDEIEYRLPGGAIGDLLGGGFAARRIERMFVYRHAITAADLAAHAKYQGVGPLRIAVTGAGGLVGSALVPLLTTGGHQVVRLVRRPPAAAEARWDPQSGSVEVDALAGVDAVVHLAGENIASRRWSAAQKDRIRTSRTRGTTALCRAVARMEPPPKVVVCASATGLYGDRGDELLTEDSARGAGFLADVVRDWEDAAQPAREAGIRVVHLRLGMVLSPRDGALAKMLTPFNLGGGGRIGSGRQYWSWISVDDAAGAVHHALMNESLVGAVNAVAPDTVTNGQFAKTMGSVLHRPKIAPLPAFAVRLALGEMADELLLASTRVEPSRLLATSYEFRQPNLEAALRHLLGRAK